MASYTDDDRPVGPGMSQPDLQPPMAQVLDRLETTVNRLEKQGYSMKEKLAPIASDRPKNEGMDSAEDRVDTRSAVVRNISDHCDRIDAVVDRLEVLMQSLDI